MILVAVTASAMTLVRLTDETLKWFGTRGQPNWLARYAYRAEVWMPPVMVPMMVGALAVRWRRPRPSARRLMRQPGAVALILGASVLTMRLILSNLTRFHPPHSRWLAYELRSSRDEIGLAVAAGWAVLAMAGALRRERGWIDGLGSIIGASWIFLWLASYIPAGVTVFP